MTGQELRRRRLALGLTQKVLGDILGVPENTIARWEGGNLNIRHPRVLALALDTLEADNRTAEEAAS